MLLSVAGSPPGPCAGGGIILVEGRAPLFPSVGVAVPSVSVSPVIRHPVMAAVQTTCCQSGKASQVPSCPGGVRAPPTHQAVHRAQPSFISKSHEECLVSALQLRLPLATANGCRYIKGGFRLLAIQRHGCLLHPSCSNQAASTQALLHAHAKPSFRWMLLLREITAYGQR